MTPLRTTLSCILLAIVVNAAPVIETYREIEIPTDVDELEGIIDLGRLSNTELAALERALQSRIHAYEVERDRGYVEDAVPIALSENDLRHLVRDRRGGARQSAPAVPVLDDDGDVELVPVSRYEQPIVVFDEGSMPYEEAVDDVDGGFVDDEPEDVIVVPVAQPPPQPEVFVVSRPPSIGLSQEEIDELQLRQRLADLGNALGERAFRGL
uniref:Secreted protein n=1 Tax=Panagrellus redivivus TaxID=6233 RepID=A0A7E4VV01_PANRE